MEAMHFISMQRRGVLNLPAELRKRHGLDEPGAQIVVAERDDGVIELRPFSAIPADQRWFWTNRWQKMEREADKDIAAGRVARFDTADDLVADLDADE